ARCLSLLGLLVVLAGCDTTRGGDAGDADAATSDAPPLAFPAAPCNNDPYCRAEGLKCVGGAGVCERYCSTDCTLDADCPAELPRCDLEFQTCRPALCDALGDLCGPPGFQCRRD